MKLQFKKQKFQEDAAKAVVDVFCGQMYNAGIYMNDSQDDETLYEFGEIANYPVKLSDEEILKNLQEIQRKNNIEPSENLEKIDDGYNFSIEMETGVGKTYTYIKTMYELNKNYGWSKFIIVVPSIAIREGVYKTFQVTEEHFAEEYGKKINYFIYNSARLSEIEHFAEDNEINAMIINSQAFNARGKDARRIGMELDEFRSRKPIEVIAKINPILIIDEPQSVEGTETRERLRDFKPLMTLRYSATHREIYNMVYRLDALDAYNMHLVKKISVTGIKESTVTATNCYIYLERINFSKSAPTATMQIDYKSAGGIRKKIHKFKIGENLFKVSNGLDEYKDNFIVELIDGRDNSLKFLNGTKISVGEVIGNNNEEFLRRIQIRETIKAHLQKESRLFGRGIKVLSLFFIDEVSHYKIYDEDGMSRSGDFAKYFEEEYINAVEEFKENLLDGDYKKYLEKISAEKTHAGYFSIDKKGKLTDSKISNRGENLSDDINAYDLIMRDKEKLLDLNPEKSPVRFIFSHSALREGWDNPNVFQICTLKQSSSDVRKRQEIGRGLRLCVNKFGERMDEDILNNEVHKINNLTVIASESYDEFTKKLQNEIAASISHRPKIVTQELFISKNIDENLARKIYNSMIRKDYVDDDGKLTEKYLEDKKNNQLEFSAEIAAHKDDIIKILDRVYRDPKVEDTRGNNIEAKIDENKLSQPEFKALWENINSKTVYEVDFDTENFIKTALEKLNEKLSVTKMDFRIESGVLEKIESKEKLKVGDAFEKNYTDNVSTETVVTSAVKYDAIGKIMSATGLLRKTVIKIFAGMEKNKFVQFRFNPEEFIFNASKIINSVKGDIVTKNIKYILTGEKYDTGIFIDANLGGRLNLNAIETDKNLYNYLIYDSITEKNFAEALEADKNVIVYVKLPGKFIIATPAGNYNPDWAIVFREGKVKKIYFAVETKGSSDEKQLRGTEKIKTDCAKIHFKEIAGENFDYVIVNNFEELWNKAKK